MLLNIMTEWVQHRKITVLFNLSIQAVIAAVKNSAAVFQFTDCRSAKNSITKQCLEMSVDLRVKCFSLAQPVSILR
jgi:hypothetical protein